MMLKELSLNGLTDKRIELFNKWGSLNFSIMDIRAVIQNPLETFPLTPENRSNFFKSVGELHADIDLLKKETLNLINSYEEYNALNKSIEEAKEDHSN